VKGVGIQGTTHEKCKSMPACTGSLVCSISTLS